MKRPKITKLSLPKVKRAINIEALRREKNDLLKGNQDLREKIKLQEQTIKELEDQCEMFEKSSENGTQRCMRYYQFKEDIKRIYIDLYATSDLSSKDGADIAEATGNPDDAQAVCLQVAAHCYRRAYSKIMVALNKLNKSMHELAKDYQQAESKEQEAKAFASINIHRGTQALPKD